MSGAAHWIRSLKDGDMQFYMRAPDGQTCKGRASEFGHRMLWARFEEWAGCKLPAPEKRRSAGHRRPA